ncbi:MAG: heme lyase NrfEFG subunit NrfE, partial [Alphaproteobacteria bacterium]|nr:heme lyase NrfEFG subunit NrfE [Alphaproteobacteria bacterium]
TALWKQEAEVSLAVGESVQIAGYTATLAELSALDTEEYSGRAARITLAQGGSTLALHPEYRQYRIRQMATSIADIYTGLWYDLYAVIGETSADGEKTAVRLYHRPLMSLFWAGFALIAAGGFMATMRRIV